MKSSARLSILVASVALAFFAVGMAALRPAAPKTVVLAPTPVVPMQVQSYDYLYTAGIWQGNVAIFSPDNPQEPLFITEIPISGLTSEDAKQFQAGIKLYSEEELAQLIEDFDS